MISNPSLSLKDAAPQGGGSAPGQTRSRVKQLVAFEAIAIVNNAISAHLTAQLLHQDKVPLERVAVILLRDVEAGWIDHCGTVLRYGGRPAHTLLGQRRFYAFFRQGAALIRRAWASPALREIYVVNSDNLLTNPFFVWPRSGAHPRSPRLTVVAEGIMNYQEIGMENRASWRWRVKPIIARCLGLTYRTPEGHLSGSFESPVERVASFTSLGLKAPASKVKVLPFELSPIDAAADTDACVILHTGLWQWMPAAEYERLGRAFADWVRQQGFKRVLAKPHPRIATGDIENWLPPHERFEDARSAEELAPAIPGATVVGMCCTALATLKLMRPDLRCIDFGADHYCRHAYGGDQGVMDFLRGSGVELVPSRL